MHILITDLHAFLMVLVRRICLNIKTSYPWCPLVKMHILLTDLPAFLMELVRRICLNIKTSYPQ